MQKQVLDSFSDEFDQALKQEQIQLFLQPRYHVKTGRIYGAEVLSRWEHPQKGLLEPRDFLPQCESCGLMGRLDYYVWEHACRLLHSWQAGALPKQRLSVKLSGQSLSDPLVSDQLRRLVADYEVPRECLQLEVEEASIRADAYQAQEAIHYLHDFGFTIILDDFSYGCSSISALNQIEADILKVDMKFFSDCSQTGKGEIVLAAIIKSVNWLGIDVFAECVETRQQNEFAEVRGCKVAQGFFFSRPIPVSMFEKQLQRSNDKEREDPKKAAGESTAASNLTVLVIDDTEMECALLEKYLKEDYHVQRSGSAEEALEYLKDYKNQVDLILVDYMMPGMNGIEFLQFCQLDERLKRIPKIMITSNERAKDQVKAFQAGAYDYLLKPLIPELVQVRVSHAMELNHRLQKTEQEKQKYQHQAEIDKATGILNKTAFHNYVEQSLTQEHVRASALFIFDIDNFKQINDTQGHLMGDEAIRLIASKLSACFRASDYVGRFGGDEFVAYMENLSTQRIAEKKAEEILKLVSLGSKEQLGFSLTISIGIGYGKSADRFDDLFARADNALYQAKNTGKGKYVAQSCE